MTLGEKIQELRKVSGLSQEALAEKMDISRQAVSKWETDLSNRQHKILFILPQSSVCVWSN